MLRIPLLVRTIVRRSRLQSVVLILIQQNTTPVRLRLLVGYILLTFVFARDASSERTTGDYRGFLVHVQGHFGRFLCQWYIEP